MIHNIAVSRIHPHPDNPRKELGDLTELANSIKANGILQNLTVVPDHNSYDCDKSEFEIYIAVIGHRRLAAAKLAGLTEVPCVISEMNKKQQLSTMLLENMQRSDLTVFEQAQGFQMMLNFGETIEAISEQTGFSGSTIRRRVKLLELDQEKLKQSVGRGATLQDYAELEKIKDIKTRNSVLEKIGTSNFQWALSSAIDKEISEKNKALLIAELEKFATQIKDASGLRSIRWYSSFSSEIKNVKPVDAADREYFFTVSPYNIQLLAKADEDKNASANNEEQRIRQERRERLNEISKRAFDLRRNFIKEISNFRSTKSMGVVIEYLLSAILTDDYNYNASYPDIEQLANFFDIEINDEDDWGFPKIRDFVAEQPERNLLITTYLMMDSANEAYYDWNNQYEQNEMLDAVYDFLEKLGYEASEEENALRDGTHDLFMPAEDK